MALSCFSPNQSFYSDNWSFYFYWSFYFPKVLNKQSLIRQIIKTTERPRITKRVIKSGLSGLSQVFLLPTPFPVSLCGKKNRAHYFSPTFADKQMLSNMAVGGGNYFLINHLLALLYFIWSS